MNTEKLLKITEQITMSEASHSSFEADCESSFPVHLLHENIRDVLNALAHAYKAPKDLIACMQLGVLSTCLGKGVYLVSNHPDPTYGHLYQFVATLPGVNKSTVLKWLCKPMKKVQREARMKQRIEVETRLAHESKNGGSPPGRKAVSAEIGKACRTLIVEHSTQEGLATTLSHNDEYLGVISSDCSGVVDDLKGSKSNGSFQGELLLKGYSGDAYDTNFKVAADEHLEEVRLSVLWAGTDETLRDFISDPRISSRGLLSRFLFAEIHEPIWSELCVAHHSSGKAGLDRGAQRDDCHRHYEPQPSRLRWLDGGIEKGRGSRRGRVGRVHGVALRALLASGESQQGSSCSVANRAANTARAVAHCDTTLPA